MNRHARILLALMLAGQLVDFATTRLGLSLGAHEGNPIMAPIVMGSLFAVLVPKLAAVVLVALLQARCTRWTPAALAATLSALAPIWNAGQIVHLAAGG